MSALEMELQPGPNPTSVRIRIKNLSLGLVSIAAPNPYLSVWVLDNNRKPYPCVRAVAWEHSRKTSQIKLKEELIVTIDLLPYWDEICGEAFVQVRIEATDDAGVSQEYVIEGNVFLNIPSYQEKYAEMKRHPKTRGLPLNIFDVSDSTHFDRVQVR